MGQEVQQSEQHKKEIQVQQCEELGRLADIERESSIRQESASTYKTLRNIGYSDQGISDMLKVVQDTVLEYTRQAGPNSGNGFLAQLRLDISLFGSLLVANVKLQYDNIEIMQRLIQHNKQLNSNQILLETIKSYRQAEQAGEFAL